MKYWQQIGVLLHKDILLEWRQKYAISGVLLYVAATVMVVYMSFLSVEPLVWITVFWIVLLFASVNAVAKSFLQESPYRRLYYYTIVSPQAVIASKLIYNTLLLTILSGIALFIYSIVLGNPVQHLALFFADVALGAVGFAACFTLLAAIAAQATQNAVLMPILSFPIVIPMLGLLIKVGKAALLGVANSDTYKDLGVLCALDIGLIALSLMLFPYLWRD